MIYSQKIPVKMLQEKPLCQKIEHRIFLLITCFKRKCFQVNVPLISVFILNSYGYGRLFASQYWRLGEGHNIGLPDLQDCFKIHLEPVKSFLDLIKSTSPYGEGVGRSVGDLLMVSSGTVYLWGY